MLRKSFSTREKVLLLILALLLIGSAYSYLVLTPCNDAIAAANSRQLDAEDAFLVEQTRLTNYKSMTSVIEEYAASSDSKIFPDYDNIQNVMNQLNSLLADSESYNISFENVTFADNTASRPITLSFTSKSYDDARDMVTALCDSVYTCSVGALTFDSSNESQSDDLSQGSVSVRLTVTFYESAVGYGEEEAAA